MDAVSKKESIGSFKLPMFERKKTQCNASMACNCKSPLRSCSRHGLPTNWQTWVSLRLCSYAQRGHTRRFANLTQKSERLRDLVEILKIEALKLGLQAFKLWKYRMVRSPRRTFTDAVVPQFDCRHSLLCLLVVQHPGWSLLSGVNIDPQYCCQHVSFVQN